MTQGGVAAYSNSWKQDTFNTSDKKIELQIDHGFWSHTVVEGSDSWIVSKVTVTNTGNIVLKDVRVYVDVDDDSPEFDAHICDSSGNITDASDTPVLVFGDVAPGNSSSLKSYWWIVKPRFPGSEGSESKTVSFNLYPSFTADFQQHGHAFISQSKLDKA